MAERKTKKSPGKGSKTKPKTKAKNGRKPLPLQLAIVMLVSLILALLALTLIHQFRSQHWLRSAATPRADETVVAEQPASAPGSSAPRARPGVKHKPRTQARAPERLPREEYQETGGHPPRRSVPAVPGRTDTPVVAIIVDDLGGDPAFMQALLTLDLEVTAAVLPNTPHARDVARIAHNGGREVMLHIPMEPKGYPAANPGTEPLFVNLPSQEVRRRLVSYFNAVPYAVGGNNHMGSRFTEDREGMAAVLAELKERGLYFVDSRTSPATVAYHEAQRLGVRTAGRDLFLDNELTVPAIRTQIRRLGEAAKVHGEAIGICHPHAETLEALRQEQTYLAQLGVRVVPASQLVR